MYKLKGRPVLWSVWFALFVFFGCSSKVAYRLPNNISPVVKKKSSEPRRKDYTVQSELVPERVDEYVHEDKNYCAVSPEAMLEKAEITTVDLDYEQYSEVKKGTENIHRNVLESLMRESSSLALKDDFISSDISVLGSEDENAYKIRDELSVIKKTKYDMPITINRYVINVIHFYLKRYKGRFEKYLWRSRAYMKMVRSVLAEEGLPMDLAYLPIIESGYSPKAYSWAHASGLWQFIQSTGKMYGLKTNWWLDERRNAKKSTRAAAKYLKKLYAQFGDWKLVLASYNAGENRVARSIKRAGTRDFWKLRLPRQTRNYVPAFMAATILARNYEFYGFKVPEDDPEWELAKKYETVLIKKRAISLRRIAKYIDVDYKDLKNLNLELRRGLIPYLKKGYLLTVPNGKKELLLASLKTHKTKLRKQVGYFDYTVERGDTLYSIARSYNIPLHEVLGSNDLGNGNYIRPGFRIKLPIYEGVPKKAKTKKRRIAKLKPYSPRSGEKKTYYKIKRGDTLSGIADRYGVGLSSVKKWNSIRDPRHIRKGQKIVLYLGKKHANKRKTEASSASDGKKVYYRIRKGDTLSGIASKYGVGLSSIKKWNHIRNPKHIRKGQRLVIYPAKKHRRVAYVKSKSRGTYTVKSGDTLWDIAADHHLRLAKLLKLNGLRQSSNIFPGDMLKVVPN